MAGNFFHPFLSHTWALLWDESCSHSPTRRPSAAWLAPYTLEHYVESQHATFSSPSSIFYIQLYLLSTNRHVAAKS